MSKTGQPTKAPDSDANFGYEIVTGTKVGNKRGMDVNVLSEGAGAANDTATTTSAVLTGTSAVVLAANSSRLNAVITNNSSDRCYLKLGDTVSASDFTLSLGQHESLILNPNDYTGQIQGIGSTTTGSTIFATETS